MGRLEGSETGSQPNMTDTEIEPTPNVCALPRRYSDFATLGEALDYAAQGSRGLNFHDPRGNLARAYPYRELREDALAMPQAADRRGITSRATASRWSPKPAPNSPTLFFGAVYAGAWPVPLPLPTSFGGKDKLYRPAGRPARQLRPG